MWKRRSASISDSVASNFDTESKSSRPSNNPSSKIEGVESKKTGTQLTSSSAATNNTWKLHYSSESVAIVTPRRKLIKESEHILGLATVNSTEIQSTGHTRQRSDPLVSQSSKSTITVRNVSSKTSDFNFSLRKQQHFERKLIYSWAHAAGITDAANFRNRIKHVNLNLNNIQKRRSTGFILSNIANGGNSSKPLAHSTGHNPAFAQVETEIETEEVSSDMLLASGFLHLSYMGWTFVKFSPQSYFSSSHNRAKSSNSTASPPTTRISSSSSTKPPPNASVPFPASSSPPAPSSISSSPKDELYFLCDFNHSFEVAHTKKTNTRNQARKKTKAKANKPGTDKIQDKEKANKETKAEKGPERDKYSCIINGGFISGWCEESLGMPIVAVEVMCKSNG